MQSKQDIYITILQYGKEKGLDLVSYEEIYTLAGEHNFISKKEAQLIIDKGNLSEELTKKKNILDKIFEDSFTYQDVKGTYAGRRMTTESYFKLIEYIELSESRLASRSARKFSIGAIFISLIAIIISGFFSWKQLNSNVSIEQPIKVESEQIEALKGKIEELNSEIRDLKLELINIIEERDTTQ